MVLGFVGLGEMGRPIAHNLATSREDLLVHSRSDRWFEEFRRAGARTTRSAADLAEVDVLFLCLPGADTVRSLLLGDDGIHPREGQIIVDLSTVGYFDEVDISEQLERSGIQFMDAPVSGMPARALEGTLTVMCGGARAVFDRVLPRLSLIGNKVLHMGPVGAGQLTKLVNQTLFDINAAALAELMPMAAKIGLDPELVTEVVNSGTGRSYASEFFLPRILHGNFDDGYVMSHAYKDLVSAAEIGARRCIPMPVLAAATATYQSALLAGYGDNDKGGMVRHFEELLGVKFRAKAAERRIQQ